MAVWNTLKVGDDIAKVLEKSGAEEARKQGFLDIQAFYHVRFLSGENKDKDGIIIKKNGKLSIFKVFLVFFIGICLNLLDMDTIRTNTRYVRSKPRIENVSA